MFQIATGITDTATSAPIGGMIFFLENAKLSNKNQILSVNCSIYATESALTNSQQPIFTYTYSFYDLPGSVALLEPVLSTIIGFTAGAQANPVIAGIYTALLTHPQCAPMLANCTVVGTLSY